MIQRLKPQCLQDKMMRVKYVKSIRRVVSDVQVSGFITIKWIIHFSNGFCLVLNRYNRTKPGDVIMTIRLRRVAKAQIAISTL